MLFSIDGLEDLYEEIELRDLAAFMTNNIYPFEDCAFNYRQANILDGLIQGRFDKDEIEEGCSLDKPFVVCRGVVVSPRTKAFHTVVRYMAKFSGFMYSQAELALYPTLLNWEKIAEDSMPDMAGRNTKRKKNDRTPGVPVYDADVKGHAETLSFMINLASKSVAVSGRSTDHVVGMKPAGWGLLHLFDDIVASDNLICWNWIEHKLNVEDELSGPFNAGSDVLMSKIKGSEEEKKFEYYVSMRGGFSKDRNNRWHSVT